MSGFGAGLVVSAGVVWSLDYVVNSFDETMNRSNFELLLVAQVRAEEQRLAAVAGGILRGGLDAGPRATGRSRPACNKPGHDGPETERITSRITYSITEVAMTPNAHVRQDLIYNEII